MLHTNTVAKDSDGEPYPSLPSCVKISVFLIDMKIGVVSYLSSISIQSS
jgi:hypothetical protein